MSLIYSGGPYRNDLYTSTSTRQGLLTSINTSLVAAGWSSSNVFSFTEFEWTGQPTAAQTVTIGSSVYTWRASSVSAFDVTIGVDGTTSAQNLFNAINAGPGAGTAYGTGTTANTQLRAADFRSSGVSSGVFRVETLTNATPFGLQNTISVSETATNQAFTFSTNTMAGYIWTSQKTPSGQQVRVYGIDALETSFPPRNAICRFYAMDENELYRSQPFARGSAANDSSIGWRLSPGQFSSWRVIASPYQFACFADSASAPTGNSSAIIAGVPYVLSFLNPIQITGATNANPIEITTGANHGYSTAENIFTRGVGGNTAANGTNVITVTAPNKYTIPVAGNGAYTSGGVCARPSNDKVAMVFYGSGDENGGVMFAYTRLGSESNNFYQNLNGGGNFAPGSVVGNFSILTVAPSQIQQGGTAMLFADGTRVILEPHVVASPTSSAKAVWVGQMYDMFVSLDTTNQATTAVVDGRNWYCLGNQAGSTSAARGSVWIVVP
ncbi:hypothetical protein UFOVP434_65 [uncultured Caudovirales phage]|uniref:Uncharacterized protein n=1 Tax=uncultured Caudovirales phage TaxID=2100421 RepID=A0A6J5MA16_9CAUD|nr:hypothetical protein UFOVP434_65 [uncultured Caudovirales phage]